MNHPDLVAQTIFCESARVETRGQVTLVGVFPDNVTYNPHPLQAALNGEQRPQIPTLCLYTRIRMPLSLPVLSDVEVLFLSPTGQRIFQAIIEKSFIEKSIDDARVQDNEYVLIMQQAEMIGFPIIESGRYRTIVNYNGKEYFAGAIRFTEGASDNPK